jgi:hypothetical protein
MPRHRGAWYNADLADLGTSRKWAKELSDCLDRVEAG